MPHSPSSRRSFIRKAASLGLTGIALKSQAHRLSWHAPDTAKRFEANDHIQVAAIGLGIMGFNNLEHTSRIPGVRIVAGCDLYAGRLERFRERYGKEPFTTRNFLEVLARPDIDAVIISTSDHWHDHMAIAALKAGKHVYVEKPMVHKPEEGHAVIEAQRRSGKVLQVGSQRVTNVVTQKAKELFRQNLIGPLVMVETWNDRQGANGAWQYSIPTDAQAGTVDWEAFLGDAPKRGYDPIRFFRWRNYQDYGTGVAGDLFVHLFSALHTVIGSNGPERAFSTGGLRLWKDGRDAPDLIAGLYDYPATAQHPAFNLQMRVNFADGNGGSEMVRLVGTEGVMELGWDQVTVRMNPVSKSPGYGGWDSFDTFASGQQKEFEKWYRSQYPEEQAPSPRTITWSAPEGYSANVDHHQKWYDGIRNGTAIEEDAWFGLRAAGPALLANMSLFEKRIIHWDPTAGKIINRK